MRKSLVAAAGVALVAGLAVTPVDAKSIAVIGMPCSDGSSIGAEYMRQGDKFSLGFQIAQAGQWHVQIIEDGAITLMDYTMRPGQVGLNIHTQKTLDRNDHVLDYHADNLTTGVTCDLSVRTKTGV